MRFSKFAAVALWAAMAVAAQAGWRGSPIESYENIPLDTTSLATAERAICFGARQRGWVPTRVSDTLVQCRLDKRGHVVVVDVPHTENSFSVRYSSSVDMDYDPATETIHRKYNQWTANLVLDIQRAVGSIPPSPPSPSPDSPTPPPSDTELVERLRKLEDLHSKGVMTDEEYPAWLQEIVNSQKLAKLYASDQITEEEYEKWHQALVDSL